jgi:hypothetical protein
MLVRSVPRDLREKLVDRLQDQDIGGSMTKMKEFLKLFNHAAPGDAVLVSQKGMEQVVYKVYQGNHLRAKLVSLATLRQVAERYFENLPMLDKGVQLAGTVSCINHMIRINGQPWQVGMLCEYVGSSNAGADPIRVGRIKSFVVVQYTVGNKRDQASAPKEEALFVQLDRFAQRSLKQVGLPSCTHYRVRLLSCAPKEVFVHVSTMSTLLYNVPDNRGELGVPLVTHSKNPCPTGYMYLVPVARAFQQTGCY